MRFAPKPTQNFIAANLRCEPHKFYQNLMLNRQNLYRKSTARSILPRAGEMVKQNEKRAVRQILNLFYAAAWSFKIYFLRWRKFLNLSAAKTEAYRLSLKF